MTARAVVIVAVTTAAIPEVTVRQCDEDFCPWMGGSHPPLGERPGDLERVEGQGAPRIRSLPRALATKTAATMSGAVNSASIGTRKV